MRAEILATTLLVQVLAGGAAVAGPSAAVFANADGSIAGNVALSVKTASGTQLFSDTASGNYDQTGFHDPANGYYLAGLCGSSDGCLGDDLVRRDFFTFNLAALKGTATAATLMLYEPAATTLPFSGLPVAPGYISTTPTLDYVLYEVSASAQAVALGNGSLAIYKDLGAGIVLGRSVLNPGGDGTIIDITLDAQALADIDHRGSFVLGGAVVPEPAALWLVGSGLLGLVFLRRLG